MNNVTNKLFIYTIYFIPMMVLSYSSLLIFRVMSGGVGRIGDDFLAFINVLCSVSILQMIVTGILIKQPFTNKLFLAGCLFSIFVILGWVMLNIAGVVYGHSSIKT